MTFFYNLNKTLDAIREKPETTHGQLNERDEGKPGKNFEKIAKGAAERYGSKEAGERVAGAVRAKLAKQGKLEEADLDEGILDNIKTATKKLTGGVNKAIGHGTDADMMMDLQKKMGLPQTGQKPQQPGQPTQQAKEGVDKAAFAALAEPKDKITFADKIAGAKKEVDEMLGDVAAEAMKNALRGNQEIADEGNAFTGKLKTTPKGGKFKMGNKEYTDTSGVDEGFPTVAGARAEMNKRKVGDVTHGAKHDVEEIPGGRRVTRRVDDKGYSVGSETDDEGNAKSTEKRGRGRPKKADKAPERVTAKATKHKGGRKLSKEEIDEAIAALEQCGYSVSPLEEKAVSKAQQKFMGMVHATQKGEKAPSKEVAKVAKTMKKSDAEDFAATKHKGLPEKKKKEKTEESGTVAGSVATSTGGKGKGGMTFGKGIYDSINREVEDMISESMNVSVNMNVDEHGEPRKSISVTAEGDAAEALAQLLNLAGMAAPSSDEGCGCETSPCSCDTELDENQPDWPTNTEMGGEDDPQLRIYAGGVNGPKSTGQTVGAPFNRQDSRQGVMGEGKDIGMKLYAELKSFKG